MMKGSDQINMVTDLRKKAIDKVIMKQVDKKGLNQRFESFKHYTSPVRLFFRTSLQLLCRT